MEALFRNTEQQDHLDGRGVITQPVLTSEEVKAIRDFYDELHPDGIPPQMRDGIHMTIWCADRAYKERIRERLLEVLYPACERIFQDFRIISPVFIVKRKGADTTFPIHQDWNVVDEARHRAFNVWIPLHAVEPDNGALWVVPGSHRLPTHVRGPGLLFPKLYHLHDYLHPRMEAQHLQAGEAMVFYHRLVHGSPPNRLDEPRVVVAFSVLPREVPLHIYFQQDASSNLEVYHPSDNFIYEFDNVRDDTGKKPPAGEPVEVRPPYEQVELTPELFDQLMGAGDSGKKPGFWQRLRALFSS